MTALCLVDGCGRNLDSHCAKGLCQGHYLRLKATGSVGSPTIKEYDSSRTCSTPACVRRVKARGLCNTHYGRWKRTGQVAADPIGKYERTGGNEYSTWHSRLARIKGAACNYECVQCGCAAQEWAYDGGDPGERIGRNGASLSLRYSTNPDRYVPMCIRCHRRSDTAIRMARKASR
jgi:hypothetical protein